jgi:hypothetical protein
MGTMSGFNRAVKALAYDAVHQRLWAGGDFDTCGASDQDNDDETVEVCEDYRYGAMAYIGAAGAEWDTVYNRGCGTGSPPDEFGASYPPSLLQYFPNASLVGGEAGEGVLLMFNQRRMMGDGKYTGNFEGLAWYRDTVGAADVGTLSLVPGLSRNVGGNDIVGGVVPLGDGRVVVGSENTCLNLWDPATGDFDYLIDSLDRKVDNSVYQVLHSADPDGNYIYVSFEGCIEVGDGPTATQACGVVQYDMDDNLFKPVMDEAGRMLAVVQDTYGSVDFGMGGGRARMVELGNQLVLVGGFTGVVTLEQAEASSSSSGSSSSSYSDSEEPLWRFDMISSYSVIQYNTASGAGDWSLLHDPTNNCTAVYLGNGQATFAAAGSKLYIGGYFNGFVDGRSGTYDVTCGLTVVPQGIVVWDSATSRWDYVWDSVYGTPGIGNTYGVVVSSLLYSKATGVLYASVNTRQPFDLVDYNMPYNATLYNGGVVMYNTATRVWAPAVSPAGGLLWAETFSSFSPLLAWWGRGEQRIAMLGNFGAVKLDAQGTMADQRGFFIA